MTLRTLPLLLLPLSLLACDRQPSSEELALNPTGICDPTLVCGQALTCVGGLEYPTTCGPANCDRPIAACETESCNPNSVCGAALTCVRGFEYPTTCGPANCDRPIGSCPSIHGS